MTSRSPFRLKTFYDSIRDLAMGSDEEWEPETLQMGSEERRAL